MRTACQAAFALLVGLSGCAPTEDPKPFPHAILTPEPAKPLPAVPLVFADGKPVPKGFFQGHYTWLYFGFANCPDICPMALEFAAREYKRLKHPEALRVVFVSVDPQRDRSPQLERFVDFYDPAFTGVTGKQADIDTLTKAVGAAYVIDKPAKPGGGYTVSHTNLVFVIDPEGRWVATYVPEAKAGAMTEDFDRLTSKESP